MARKVQEDQEPVTSPAWSYSQRESIIRASAERDGMVQHDRQCQDWAWHLPTTNLRYWTRRKNCTDNGM